MFNDGLIVPVFWSKAQSISSEDQEEMSLECLRHLLCSVYLLATLPPQKKTKKTHNEPLHWKKKKKKKKK